MSLMPVFGRPRQEDRELKANLGYSVRPYTAIQGGQGMAPFLPLVVFGVFRLGVGASGRVNVRQLAAVAECSGSGTGPTLLPPSVPSS